MRVHVYLLSLLLAVLSVVGGCESDPSSGAGDDAGAGDGASQGGDQRSDSNNGGGAADAPLAAGRAGAGRLAYMTSATQSGDAVIEVMDLDAAEVIWRSDPARRADDFAISADGSTLAYVWARAEDSTAIGCSIIDLEGGAESSCSPASAPSIIRLAGLSRGGDRLGLVSVDFLSETPAVFGVFEGGAFKPWQPVPIPNGSRGMEAMSADGSVFVVAEFDFETGSLNGNGRLVAYEEGQEARVVYALRGDESLSDARISVDEAGTRAAFSVFGVNDSGEPVAEDVKTLVVNLESGAATAFEGVIWSRLSLDGSTLVGQPRLFEGVMVYDAGDPSAPKRVHDYFGNSASLSPNGDRVAFRDLEDLRPERGYYDADEDDFHDPTVILSDGTLVEVHANGSNSYFTNPLLLWAE